MQALINEMYEVKTDLIGRRKDYDQVKFTEKGVEKIIKKPEIEEDDYLKKTNYDKLFQVPEGKVRLQKLHEFVQQYNYYINKILWSRQDEFLQKKRE